MADNKEFSQKEQDEIIYDAHCLHEIRKNHPEYNKYIDWLGNRIEIKPIIKNNSGHKTAHTCIIIDDVAYGLGTFDYVYTKLVPKNKQRNKWRCWLMNLTVAESGQLAYLQKNGDCQVIDSYDIMKMFLRTHYKDYDKDNRAEERIIN